jgi:hypothetical protein
VLPLALARFCTNNAGSGETEVAILFYMVIIVCKQHMKAYFLCGGGDRKTDQEVV